MLTLEEVKKFLRIDYDDEDEYLNTLIMTSLIRLKGAVRDHETKIMSTEYNALSNQFMLLLINDAYSNRSLISDKEQEITFTAKSILSQLKYGVFA